MERERGTTGVPPETAAQAAAVADEHWAKTRRLMWITLALWFIFGFAIHAFAEPLSRVEIFGFPLSFYMAAQGSLIAFVIIIFWYAARQNRIDAEYGVDEK